MSAPAPTVAPPTLRPYQVELINDLYRTLNAGHRRVAIIAGTGAGKTVISGQICAHAEAAGKRLMFLVHLDVLVGQTYEKMKAFGLHCGFIKAGWTEDREAPIQIASVQTMAQRKWWRTWPADVVFYDEAHTTLFTRVGQSVLGTTHPHAVHLAMTATPERLGKDQLGEYMETLVAAPVPGELQAMGYLAPMQYYSMPPDGVANLQGVKTVRGDFDEGGLKNACDRPELVAKIVQEWQRLVPGKRTIAFCVDVEHARNVATAFQQGGIPADVVEGNTPIKERQRLYGALRQGDIQVLTSCNVISIGFDEPSVEVGLLLRPTQSSALHFQQVGRVMRISPATGKEFGIILDQAGNLERLGFPEDVEAYHLPTRKEGSGGGQAPPMKACPQCGRLVHSFVVKCPGCSHQWLSERPLNLEDMVAIYSRDQAHRIKDIPTLIAIFHGHRRRVFASGYAPALADRQFWEHTGRQPQPHWALGSIFGPHPTPTQRQAFWEYLHRSARRLGRHQDPHWLRQEFEREFGVGSWEPGGGNGMG